MNISKKLSLLLFFTATTNYGESKPEPKEKFVDKVEVVAIAVKDVVADTAGTVKRGVAAGADVAKGFIASTAAKVKIALQEARAKQADKRAQEALEKNEKAQKMLADTQEQLKIAQATLQQTQKAIYIRD
jgi:hypothetical protein